MAEKLNQIQLLNQALAYRGRTLEWLSEQMNLSVKAIPEVLELGNVGKIRKIANCLELPLIYFWGGLRLENGELVEINPPEENNTHS